MAQTIIDTEDLNFVLFDQFKIDRLKQYAPFTDYNRKVIEMIVKEARHLAIEEILPTAKIGDIKGCRYENGMVLLPKEFKKAWKLMAKGEWLVPSADTDLGGQNMPKSVALAAKDFFNGANMALTMIGGLSQGAAQVIESFGTTKQKKRYLKKIISGEWAVSMQITEPDAGSDLNSISTIAKPTGDSAYRLSGNKLFITGGDHNLTDNIIHLVLARINNAPAGSKGLSLFLVPGIHVDAEGQLGHKNDIICTGIEEKMGLHGSPTCSMSLGSRDNCIGSLLGEENKGLFVMFSMMNDARLLVGSQGHACASSAYLYALDYARNRIQGTLNGSKNGVAIIEHPDVKRLLLTMKTFTQGIRSILFYIAWCQDMEQVAKHEVKKQEFHDLTEILIPIGKGYVTDRAVEVCDMAIQIYGGYGYCCEYPVEQLYRDVRITTIYEGTNGIQAQDLMDRKLLLHNGRLVETLISKIEQTINLSGSIKELFSITVAYEKMLGEYKHLLQLLTEDNADKQNTLKRRAMATNFLSITGDLVMGWMLLWRAVAALQQKKKSKTEFISGQIYCVHYFMENVRPVTMGRMESILNGCDTILEMSSDLFGSI